jgi:hypothetical protein
VVCVSCVCVCVCVCVFACQRYICIWNGYFVCEGVCICLVLFV